MDVNKIARLLFFSMQQAGIVARMMQADIINEKKETIRMDGETDAHFAMREAKTKVDEMVQELLLQSVYPHIGTCCSLDVEEDTASLALYPSDQEYVLILDPIDGTLPYIEQRDNYSICAGITYQSDFLLAMVYFPKRDMLYLYTKDMGCKKYEDASRKQFDEGIYLTSAPLSSSKIIYVNERVEASFCDKLCDLGYTVYYDTKDGIGVPDVLLGVMQQSYCACVCKTRNLRDILLGVILSKMEYGCAVDFSGKPVVWKASGRQPEVIFTFLNL